jgi:hypothetical protein
MITAIISSVVSRYFSEQLCWQKVENIVLNLSVIPSLEMFKFGVTMFRKCSTRATIFRGAVMERLCGETEINMTTAKFSSRIVITRPPLWSSGQSSWLQIQRSGFDSRHYQIFWEVVGLERGPLILLSTTEELLDRKVAAPV